MKSISCVLCLTAMLLSSTLEFSQESVTLRCRRSEAKTVHEGGLRSRARLWGRGSAVFLLLLRWLMAFVARLHPLQSPWDLRSLIFASAAAGFAVALLGLICGIAGAPRHRRAAMLSGISIPIWLMITVASALVGMQRASLSRIAPRLGRMAVPFLAADHRPGVTHRFCTKPRKSWPGGATISAAWICPQGSRSECVP